MIMERLSFVGWLKRITEPSLNKYIRTKKDCIIITQSKAEVEVLHNLIWGKFQDWNKSTFSVPTSGYSSEWHWTYKDGKLAGSSGSGSYQNTKERNPDLPVFYFKEYKD